MNPYLSCGYFTKNNINYIIDLSDHCLTLLTGFKHRLCT